MRAQVAALFAGLLIPACVLPSVEVDENFNAAGAGGSGGSAGRPQIGGAAGRGGSAGSAAMAGRGGTAGAGADAREAACINYCTRYFQACLTHEANSYDDIDDCFATCATAEWPFNPGQPDETNSLQCREIHAGFAVTIGPEQHCFHSAEVPSNGACD